jgi:hypothetical protein
MSPQSPFSIEVNITLITTPMCAVDLFVPVFQLFYTGNYFTTCAANFIPKILIESSLQLVETILALKMNNLVMFKVILDI